MKHVSHSVRTSLFAVTAGALLFASACGPKKAEAAKSENQAPSDPLKIEVSPTLRSQLKVGQPEWREVAKTLDVAARIEADATRQARVGSPVRGRIAELLAFEGERVKRGQPLAILYSTDLSDAQFAFLKAVSQQSLSERAVERGKQLLDADVIGTAEQQRRQAELVQATAEVSSLRQQLQALGMSEDSIRDLESSRKLNSRYEISASIDGTVLERSVTVGQIVQPAEVAFLLADLSTVWLVADIPEQNAGDVAVGKTVEAEAAAFPGEPIVGHLAFVSATVNPESRTVKVRMNVSNPKGRYKPAMLATMKLKDRVQRERVVPVTAVVRENNRDNVFIQTGPRTFVLREVELGGEFGDVRALTAGVEPNETVVLDGAFHVNNERKKALQGGA
ncbi:MAG: efflux RND transporter periplasmic adaptor subunit [Bryobacteraceae bacterium]